MLWQKDVGKLEEDLSYSLEKVKVRVYDGINYLSVSELSTITETAEIGAVADLDRDALEQYMPATTTCSVLQGNMTTVLRGLPAKVKIDGLTESAECTKCGGKMKAGRCHYCKMARVVFEEKDSSEEHRLTIFDDVLQKITENVSGYD